MHINITLLLIIITLSGHCLHASSHVPASSAVTTAKPNTPHSVQLLRERLVGWWYGDQPTKDGGRNQWICQRSADGTFRITFRKTDAAGQVKESVEVGEWGVHANLLITLTKGLITNGEFRTLSVADPYLWDVYEILNFEADSKTYRTIETGNEYRAKKVEDGFMFPK